MKRVLLLLILTVLLGGCSVLNPYRSEFTCPQKEDGKCVSVDNAYYESLIKTKDKVEKTEPIKNNGQEKSPKSGVGQRGENLYQEEVFRKLTGLLKEPVTPLVAPPRVMRVLLLPYKGEAGDLFMPRYIYFMAEEPRWIMGGYLQEGAGD